MPFCAVTELVRSSTRFSRASAKRTMAAARSAGGQVAHPECSQAWRAAPTARSTSASVASGTVPMASSVVALMTVKRLGRGRGRPPAVDEERAVLDTHDGSPHHLCAASVGPLLSERARGPVQHCFRAIRGGPLLLPRTGRTSCIAHENLALLTHPWVHEHKFSGRHASLCLRFQLPQLGSIKGEEADVDEAGGAGQPGPNRLPISRQLLARLLDPADAPSKSAGRTDGKAVQLGAYETPIDKML